MPAPVPFSLRITLAKPSRDIGEVVAKIGKPSEKIRKAISLGMQKLALRAQKERFTGKGPFPPSEKRLGVVSGRLRRAVTGGAEEAEIVPGGYQARLGAAVEYFAAHELGFQGQVNVPAHKRDAYTVKRKARKGTSKSGKDFSVRANQYSVLPGSVRAHTRRVNIPDRRPLRTAIEEHGGAILGAEIRKAVTA